jgi:fatty-acyl-CoA synthase
LDNGHERATQNDPLGIRMDISFFTRHCLGDAPRFSPESLALGLESDEPITYGELAMRSRSYANSLLALGVSSGDRVGILLFNSVEYWLAYFAITRIGAIAVRLNFRLGPQELQYAIEDSGATALLVERELLVHIELLRAKLPVQHYVVFGAAHDCPDWTLPWSLLEEGSNDNPVCVYPNPENPAMIMYTSGTTGRPKGALWSHSTTTWWAAMQVMEWRFTPESVTMVTGPLYHVGSLENYSLPTLAVGGRVVLLRSKYFSVDRVLKIASEQHVTDLLLFPSMIYQMLQLRNLLNFDLSSIRRIFTGGDPLLPAAGEELMQRFDWIDLVQVYGLTEGTPVISCGAPGGFARIHPESVGRAFPFCEITIRDNAGEVVKPGERGEIWTRSPANAISYWKKPAATTATFVDGWCKTGDLGVVEGGYLRIIGRKKDMIRSGGENIYPAEVEAVLLRHPKIVDAAVVGIPDATFVETVCAVVVLVAGAELTESEVIHYCIRNLASYKKPRKVLFVDKLPRTPSQKIMKYKLREALASEPVSLASNDP